MAFKEINEINRHGGDLFDWLIWSCICFLPKVDGKQ